MLNTVVNLEVKQNEKTYTFVCTPDSPLGEIYDVLSVMRSYIVNRMQEETKKQESSEEIKENVDS